MIPAFDHATRLARLATLALGLALFTTAAHADAKPNKPQAAKVESANVIVDLNRASEQELTQLPGIGPSKARAIIELRTRLGGFKKVEDLMRVKGIGRKTFRKLEPMLRVGPPAAKR